jgi:hypothetical protein
MLFEVPVPLLLAAASAVSRIEPQLWTSINFHLSVLYADSNYSQLTVQFLSEQSHQCRLHRVLRTLWVVEWLSSDSRSQSHGLIFPHSCLLHLSFGEFTTESCKNMPVGFTVYIHLHVIWTRKIFAWNLKLGKLHYNFSRHSTLIVKTRNMRVCMTASWV